jgi:hypothetical protein
MSSTTRVPTAELTGVYGWLLKRFSRKLLGDVPEPAEVMSHNRAVLSSFTGFGRRAQASQVPRWRESQVFTPLERDVMEYAEAMSETPPRVTDDLSDRLLDQLGAPAVVELTAWVGFSNPDHEVQHGARYRVPRFLQGVRAPVGATAGPVRGHGVNEDAFALYRSLRFTVGKKEMLDAGGLLRWRRAPRRACAPPSHQEGCDGRIVRSLRCRAAPCSSPPWSGSAWRGPCSPARRELRG